MNLRQLAHKLDVSETTVAVWVKKGVPHWRTKTGGYHFTVNEVRRWRAANLAPTGPSTYAEARARKESALAGLRELQLKVRTAELVTKASVEKAVVAMARWSQDRMENIPPRVSGICAAERDQGKIFKLLTKEIRQALEDLSDERLIKMEWAIPVPSQGLSPQGVVRVRAMLLAALDAAADQIEAATDLGCDPASNAPSWPACAGIRSVHGMPSVVVLAL